MKKIMFFMMFLCCGTLLTHSQVFNGGTALAIPDDNCDATNEFAVTVSGVGTLGTTNQIDNVTVDITHTWSGDLDITLIGPGGTPTLLLTSNNGGSADDYSVTVFSDAGATNITSGSAPFNGTFQPQGGALTPAFDGVAADGDWTLQVCDTASGDLGTINSWSIEFVPVPTCSDVSGIAVSNISATSADISWTAGDVGDTLWEVAVQAQGTGEPAAADNTGTDTGSNPYTASGLTSETDYEVWVRTDCGGGDLGDWIGPENFTTPCAAIAPEYFADMSVNVPDACWDEAGSGDPAAGPGGLGASDWRQNRAYAFGPSNAINLWQAVDQEWLLSPVFDLSSGGPYQLEVNVAVTDYAFSGTTTTADTMGSDDEVQLLVSTDGGATWTNLTTWNVGNQPDVAGTEYVEDLTAYSGNVQFAIWATDGAVDDSEDYDFHVGKFDVVNIPSSVTVDFCNLQFPGSGTIDEGDPFTPFARIFQDGVTQPAGASGLVEAWIGVSETDATTVADFETGAWTWTPATFNTQVGNDDEYSVDIGSGLTPGSYFYVSRFRVDNGVFAYGGNTAGPGEGGNFWDGSSFVSGQLTVNAAAPTTAATFNISGCGDSDTYSAAYDAAVDGIVWVELIYDGGCFEITTDTETTTGIDTEIGLYDEFGNRINNDDDGGTGTLSSLTETGLAAGTYYIAAGAFNVTFNATNFDVSTANTTATGTLVINAGTPNTPDFVNLQFPGEETITAGGTATVFAQIFETGVTPGAGAGAGITAEIGVSAVDATTLADFETVDWTWTTAPYFGEVGNNDEYSLDIGASLAPGTYYYVSRFSVDGGPFAYGGNTAGPGEGGNFWDGSSFVSGVLTVNPAGEPTNHVDSFAAVADSDTEITLTWNDNDGAQAANGFLIVGKTGAAAFYTPVDGTDPADDTDWSDDEFEVQVGSGVGTYTVTGLNASTTYDFEIYPFTNSGATIDFKTDGTVPSASATTDADPCSIAINSFPFTEGFESGVPPTCWTSFRGTNGLGTGFDWTTSGTANTGSSSAFVRYENVTGGNAQDWLVTPLLDFSGLTAPELSFFARESFSSDFGSVHSVQVSTTTNDLASFTSVQGYTEADFSNTTFEEFVVDLSAYAGEATVYVAFVMENDDGDSWFIDDVTIDDNVPVTYTFNGTWAPTTPEGNATSSDDIVIASGDYVMTTDITCNRLDIQPGASMTINGGTTLTLNDVLQLQSNSTSFSSLILDGAVSGPILYDRYVNINGTGDTGSNDLVSAPLTGQPFSAVAAGNPNILNNGTLYLFGPFDKTTGTYVTWAGTETATLDPGVGYRAATSDGSVVTFSGTANNGIITSDIQSSGPAFIKWNLIGNPYPSYLNVQDFLNEDVGGGETNLTLFDATTAAIYGYDGDATDGWVIYNLATTSPTTVIAPGQGFFVSADATKTAGFDVEFTPAMRSTGSSDDFIAGRNAELSYMILNVSAGNKSNSTDFYFNPAATEGFDLGYDAGVFGGTPPDFGVYSHLVEGNAGQPMALQAMNASSLSNVTIPLGVNANQGEQITFSIADSTLPQSVNVYLEDVVANTSTLLNAGDYVITPTNDLVGTGRFFITYTEDSLSTIENSLDNLNIFALNSTKELVVSGQLQDDTILDIYDIQGRKVLSADLDINLIENRLDVSNLTTGVYMVTVENNNQNITKKVILK